ncbi:MAG: hypothetical protein HYX79_01760 [Chloroflexi bacterium]|nr:hypothetical protein [Chloroflexota bacterium]
MREKIICPAIEIKGSMTRHEIVQKVINTFINTEHQQRGKGVQFWYPVEQLSGGSHLFILRPGGLQKWNFDFKVNVTPDMGFGKGKHEDIASDIRNKKLENPEKFGQLQESVTEVYSGTENDVDQILLKHKDLNTSFQTGAKVEILLKVLKWMFIMEDIVYWNYDGRTKLYNYLREI